MALCTAIASSKNQETSLKFAHVVLRRSTLRVPVAYEYLSGDCRGHFCAVRSRYHEFGIVGSGVAEEGPASRIKATESSGLRDIRANGG